MYPTAAVHNPDRETTDKEMRNPLNVQTPSNANKAPDVQRTPPSFVVGQDEEGHWVALEADGGGGLFVNREAAVKYAKSEAGRRSAVLIFCKGARPNFREGGLGDLEINARRWRPYLLNLLNVSRVGRNFAPGKRRETRQC